MPRAQVRTFNTAILIFLFLLLSISIAMVYSTTHSSEISTVYSNYYLKQLMWAVLGTALMFLVSRISYTIWIELAGKLYWITIAMLLALLIFGRSMRWFHIGPFTFQPSEFAKVTMLFALTRFILDNKGKVDVLMGFAKISLLLGLPLVLIVIQPDLGTGLVFIPLFFCLLYVGKVSTRYIVYSISLLIPAGVASWYFMKDYQRMRLISFMNPEADPLGSGYSIIQSKIAIGSGGLFGKGFMKGTQSQLNFIPEHHTDFIFSVIGEELGFFLVLVIIMLFFAIIMEGIKIAKHAKDMEGSMLAAGVVALITTQLFMNIGMTLGILPVVGVPLPFMSYGGSSMLFSMMLIGVLLNVNNTIKKF
ncbi:MAG: rod shape-determining protein RodA [Candidatus Firestonebacteria bacterium]